MREFLKLSENGSCYKKMVVIFLKSSRIVEHAVLETQKTVTAKWYTQRCLPKVIESI